MTVVRRRVLELEDERFPIRGTFTISRGSRREAHVVTCTIHADAVAGRGECVPYARYRESVESVRGQIESVRAAIESGISRDELRQHLPAGAARNALDCALIDLEAKQQHRRAWEITGLAAPTPKVTAYTISLASPGEMADKALEAADRPLLKLKLGDADDIDRVAAVREVVPRARLIVDANEAWTPERLVSDLDALAALGVELVEQPLPAAADAALGEIDRTVPVCADESCHDRAGLATLATRYDVINVKLDKTGGLTEAIELTRTAEQLGLGIMVGCMVSTSLAMAPAVLLGGQARFVDLDGPLLLARDRSPALEYRDGNVLPPRPELWG